MTTTKIVQMKKSSLTHNENRLIDDNNNMIENKKIVDESDSGKEENSLFPSIEIPATILPHTQSSDNTEVKKFKRKKRNLDQLLPQVEAKKRREEKLQLTRKEVSSPFSAFRPIMTNSKRVALERTEATTNNISSFKTSTHGRLNSPNSHGAKILDVITKLGNSKHKYKQAPQVNTSTHARLRDFKTLISTSSASMSSVAGSSKTNSGREEAKDTKSLSNFPVKPPQKINKRTMCAKQRYSSLSSSQLQRRLVANARERSRVHALSNAFNSLRCAIPSYSTEQKLSKLTILRVAINYINALQNIIDKDGPSSSFVKCVDECSNILQTEYGRSKSKHGGIE